MFLIIYNFGEGKTVKTMKSVVSRDQLGGEKMNSERNLLH